MKAVQIVMEEQLLRAADREARKAKMNRSAFVREAVREHIARRARAKRVEQDRAGYLRQPDTEFDAWRKVSTWPED
jgi:metal-responsive CopG/Arc/MetJ family transcriptional regulator